MQIEGPRFIKYGFKVSNLLQILPFIFQIII